MKEPSRGAVTLVSCALVAGFVGWGLVSMYQNGVRSIEAREAAEAAEKAPCASEQDFTVVMQDWFNTTYPGVTHMGYDEWLTMTHAAYDAGQAASPWQGMDHQHCDQSWADVTEAFVFAVPHDEAPEPVYGPDDNRNHKDNARCRVSVSTSGLSWSCSVTT